MIVDFFSNSGKKFSIAESGSCTGVIQILLPCSEMERLEIGLGPLKDTRVRCGVAAWIPMLYVLHLVPQILVRM